MCWGTFSNAGSSSGATVTFIRSFLPQTIPCVVATRQEGTSTATLDTAKCTSVNNVSFVAVTSYVATQSATYSNNTYSWFAIGKWA